MTETDPYTGGAVPCAWPEDDPDARLLALVRTGDWLDAQVFPPLRWAVHGLIPQGFGLFTGPPKAGKSWAALGFAIAISSGGKALGKIETGHPRPVLYLALEDGDARLQWRTWQLLGEGVPIPPLLHTVTQMSTRDVVPLISAWLARHGHAAPLVLLDTLGKVMPPANPGEGAYQRDYRVGGTLKGLVDKRPGSTLLVVHHTRKQQGEDWMDSTSGTNGLNGAADFTLNLSRGRNEDSGVLRVTGRDVAESEYAITSSDGAWTIDGATLADAAAAAVTARAVADLGDRSAEIVAYVATQPQPVSPKAVEEALSLPDARRYLARLADAGRLTKAGRGLYTPVPTVPSVPMEQGNGTTGQWGHHLEGDNVPTCSDCGHRLGKLDAPIGACLPCRRISAAEASAS
jgi:hypothetical protein